MTTTLHLPAPRGYSFHAVVNSHGWRDLAPFRYDADAATLHRVHRLASGRVIHLTLTDGVRVTADVDLTDAEQHELTTAVRRMLAMNTDLTPFYDAIRDEARYDWVEAGSHGRLLASPTLWEDLVKILFTTNVSWRNTISMCQRITAYGDAAPDGRRTFPTPAQIAAQSPEELTAQVRAGYRVKGLHALATAISSGELNVEGWRDPAWDAGELYQHVSRLHGYGAYAAGSAMRMLGHHEWLAIDSVARAAYAAVHNGGDPATDKDIEAFYAPYGHWRGLALWMDILSS